MPGLRSEENTSREAAPGEFCWASSAPAPGCGWVRGETHVPKAATAPGIPELRIPVLQETGQSANWERTGTYLTGSLRAGEGSGVWSPAGSSGTSCANRGTCVSAAPSQSLGAEGTKERVGSPRQQVREPFCQGFAGPHGSGSRAAAARGGEAEPWPAGSAAPGRSGAGGGCAGARSAGLDPVRCARSNVTLQGEMELF